MKLSDLFEVAYGNKFDFNKMTVQPGGINFVGRSGSRQGVSGRVALIDGVDPYPAGLVTVALGGASRLASFVQTAPFYTAQNVAVLTPRTTMTTNELLYWCMAIRANRYRYEGFGREANRTLGTLELPDTTPTGLDEVATAQRALVAGMMPSPTSDEDAGAESATLGDIFDIRYGQSLELNRLTRAHRPDGVNFVSRTDKSNGVSARVHLPDGVTPAYAGELSVALGGSPLATFLQLEQFVCGRDVAILTAKAPMTDAVKLWYAMCIKRNRHRFSYGRQANRTLATLVMPERPPGTAAAELVADCREFALTSLAAV